MNISAHWLVADKTGRELDIIEAELHDITNADVDRTDSPCKTGNINARFRVRGNIHATDLDEACEYMDGVGSAYPV